MTRSRDFQCRHLGLKWAKTDDAPKPRASHLRKWADFNGYGFNLHAEKGKAGQFIGKVDPDSPAESAGLKPGDRIVEVNDVNIGNENHQQVVVRIKAGYNGSLDETKLLVVDNEADQYYKSKKLVIRGDMPNVVGLAAPPIRGGETIVTVSNGHIAEPEPEPVVTETVTTVTETVITEAQSGEAVAVQKVETTETSVNKDGDVVTTTTEALVADGEVVAAQTTTEAATTDGDQIVTVTTTETVVANEPVPELQKEEEKVAEAVATAAVASAIVDAAAQEEKAAAVEPIPELQKDENVVPTAEVTETVVTTTTTTITEVPYDRTPEDEVTYDEAEPEPVMNFEIDDHEDDNNENIQREAEAYEQVEFIPPPPPAHSVSDEEDEGHTVVIQTHDVEYDDDTADPTTYDEPQPTEDEVVAQFNMATDEKENSEYDEEENNNYEEVEVNKEPEPEPALTETEVAVAAVAVAAAAEETRREPTPPPREPTPPPREPTPPPREPTPPPVVVQQTETTVVTTTTTVNGISEPEPAPEPKGPIDPATGLELNVSVAEMKERLSSRRKRDSRNAALNFKDKYEMFQRL
ncbi:unnamed protein product [Owenia fusiformis]|uniref:PDZ domain-containing protein n=1 Tax=Owenia fusiformis TaxID=6347 RepID=A0A8S4P832_OWEFU|nr:unnamed protein product [Owenia fusiformis]